MTLNALGFYWKVEMDVLLVDLILGSHSVSYASNIKQELEERQEITRVDFLTLTNDDRLDEYFDSLEDVYFIDESEGCEDVGYGTPIVDYFRDLVEFMQKQSYDVIHILQIDNVLIESAIIISNIVGSLPPIIAQINGAFFSGTRNARASSVYRHISRLLSSPLGPIVRALLVKKKSNNLVSEFALYSCIQNRIFSHLLVHTSAAKEYVSNICSCTTPVTVVPEPSTVDDSPFSKQVARQQIGINTREPTLLFFGGLRYEKGINQLLQAMEYYNGPHFTLLIAGPENGVTKQDLQELKDSISPSLSMNIGYIYDSEKYFIAADGVLCPYLDKFGSERTSHVFQEAIRLNRPVIAPSFGTFESRLSEYNLGILYSPNTPQALNEAIIDFINNPKQRYSSKDMAEFAEKHSFENLCSSLVDIYYEVS